MVNYLGKVRSHAPGKFTAVKGSFTKIKVSRITAPNNSPSVHHRKGQAERTLILKLNNAIRVLLVFSVTPFKIDQNKAQNRSID